MVDDSANIGKNYQSNFLAAPALLAVTRIGLRRKTDVKTGILKLSEVKT
ncbi:hypothetical protein [Lentibacillus juripiscarius]|uniref:Uncharacterized protein n=1 Tax=Lentibacillus juripiscarius TaxID=257446 RepID=A0ABW5V944_9BACI